MDFSIDNKLYSFVVRDLIEDIKYSIPKNGLQYIQYNRQRFDIPLISEIMKSYTDLNQFILDNHSLIKEYIKLFNKILDNLPVLSICKLPECNGNFIFEGIECHLKSSGIILSGLNYDLHIYKDSTMYLLPDIKYNMCYPLDKIQINNQPYNQELLFGTIKLYIDNYLCELINLFKPMKCKSANKLN